MPGAFHGAFLFNWCRGGRNGSIFCKQASYVLITRVAWGLLVGIYTDCWLFLPVWAFAPVFVFRRRDLAVEIKSPVIGAGGEPVPSMLTGDGEFL